MMNFKWLLLLFVFVHSSAMSQESIDNAIVNLDSISDISERVRLYKELSLKEQTNKNYKKSLIYRSLFNSLNDSLYIIERDSQQVVIENQLNIEETGELLHATERKLEESQKSNQHLIQFLKTNFYLVIFLGLTVIAVAFLLVRNIKRKKNLINEQGDASIQFCQLNESNEKIDESIQFMELHSKEVEVSAEIPDWMLKLSKKESQVLKLLAQGMTDKEISEAMTVSLSTTRTYCRRIYTKLMVKNRSEAAVFAQKHGLI